MRNGDENQSAECGIRPVGWRREWRSQGEREGGRGEEIGRQREKRGYAEDLRAEFRGGENGEDGFGRRAGGVR